MVEPAHNRYCTEPLTELSHVHTGKQLSVRQQIDYLRTLGESSLTRAMLPIAALTFLAAVVAFWITDSQNLGVLWLFVAGCSALLMVACALSAGHLRNAARATRAGRRERAVLQLQQPEDNDERQFHGRLQLLTGERAWEMDFAPVSGWLPQADELIVDVVFLADIQWPVLVLSDQGLLWPRTSPKRVAATAKPRTAR